MIPTAAVARGADHGDVNQLHRRVFYLPHQQELLQTTKDPIMLTFRSHPDSSSFKQTDQQSLLTASLNQFSGKMHVSATQLIQALDAAYQSSNNAKNGSSGGGMTAETMEWDEFDINGSDMMQMVYEDRLKKAQALDAANNKPQPKAVAPQQQQQQQQQQQEQGRPAAQRPAAVDIDSDDSDFGEQIKAQKKKQKSNQQAPSGMKMNTALQASQQYRRASTIPVGATLPPGMTILDMSSSDEDMPNKGGKKNQNLDRPPRFSNAGPKVVTMSLKPDQSTPLSMSLAHDTGLNLFGRQPMMFDDAVLEESDEDAEDAEDDDEADVDQPRPLNKQLPSRPVNSASSSNANPERSSSPIQPLPPSGGDVTPTNVLRPPRPTLTGPSAAIPGGNGAGTGGRMSLWERAKVSAPAPTGSALVTTTANTTTANTTTANASTSTARPTIALPKPPITTNASAATTTSSTVAPSNTATTVTTAASKPTPTPASPTVQKKEQLVFGFQEVVPGSLKPSSPQQSKLTQELNDSGFLRNAKRQKDINPRRSMVGMQSRQNMSKRSGPAKTISVRFKFNTKPLPVHVYNDMCVDELIQASLEAYQQARCQPPLQSVLSMDYHLHVWDDDENDIDTDIPQFNRSQIISKIDTASLCLLPDKNLGTRKPQQLEDEYDSDFGEYRPTSAAGTPGPKSPTADSLSREKSNTVIQAPTNPIEHDQDTYEHHNQIQVSEDTLTTLDSLSTYIHQLYSQMTHATAGKQTEYKVFKINEKGKRQERYFGLDRYNIYNKTTPSSKFNTFSKLMNISKTERPIKSIIHVRVLPESLTTFQISYKEDGSDTITSRGYEVESVMTCAEIVAKLRYLINNP